MGIIQAFQGKTNLSVGTVAAGRLFVFGGFHLVNDILVAVGWQNFFVCIEMCLAAVALRFAFSHEPYVLRENSLPSSAANTTAGGTSNPGGRIVTLQSISNNLKETMNPKDIMHGKNTRST